MSNIIYYKNQDFNLDTINEDKKEEIKSSGYYKLVSKPLFISNGEQICIFNTVKIEDNVQSKINNIQDKIR